MSTVTNHNDINTHRSGRSGGGTGGCGSCSSRTSTSAQSSSPAVVVVLRGVCDGEVKAVEADYRQSVHISRQQNSQHTISVLLECARRVGRSVDRNGRHCPRRSTK